MEWFKKHADTIVVLGSILSSVFWMNSQFSGIEKEMAGLKTEIAIIKTVLIVKQIMPQELSYNDYISK